MDHRMTVDYSKINQVVISVEADIADMALFLE
jgi:hypothetical protein